MTKIIIAIIILLIIAWALTPTHAATSAPQGRATFTPLPIVTPVPTYVIRSPIPDPAYPAPAERRHSAPRTTPSGLQCARC